MSKNSDLGTRLGVALLLILVSLAALWWGGLAFWLLVSIVAIVMIGEWANLVGASAKQRLLSQYALSVPLAIMAPGLAAGPGFLALGLIFAAFFFLAIVTRSPRIAGGALYVGLPVLSLLVLRDQAPWTQGVLLTLWAMALVWASDSGAYFAGRAIGGPKFAPAISPNKTWAGFFGGIVAAGAFAAILVVAFDLPLMLAVATPLLAALSQFGDLFESHLKRRAGVKDSGNLLPGHGGVMDRLDGLVPVAPVAALLALGEHWMHTGQSPWL